MGRNATRADDEFLTNVSNPPTRAACRQDIRTIGRRTPVKKRRKINPRQQSGVDIRPCWMNVDEASGINSQLSQTRAAFIGAAVVGYRLRTRREQIALRQVYLVIWADYGGRAKEERNDDRSEAGRQRG